MFDFGKLARTITRAANFGEWIVYAKASGATRRIRAAVKRVPAQTLPETTQVLRPYMEVTVEDDATSGINADELEMSTDTLAIKLLHGKTKTLSIARILRHSRSGACSGGILVLEVR